MTEALICLGLAFAAGIAGSVTSRRAERRPGRPLLNLSIALAALCALAIIAAVIFLCVNK